MILWSNEKFRVSFSPLYQSLQGACFLCFFLAVFVPRLGFNFSSAFSVVAGPSEQLTTYFCCRANRTANRLPSRITDVSLDSEHAASQPPWYYRGSDLYRIYISAFKISVENPSV